MLIVKYPRICLTNSNLMPELLVPGIYSISTQPERGEKAQDPSLFCPHPIAPSPHPIKERKRKKRKQSKMKKENERKEPVDNLSWTL